MESATKVSFAVEKEAALTLVTNTDCTKSVVVDGKKYVFEKGIATITVPAGLHAITKGDSNVNLYYISVK